MAQPTFEKVDEELHAQGLIWNHIFQFITSMSLKSAVELRIPDILHAHGKPISLSDLAAKLDIPPGRTSSLRRLMRVLVSSGCFATESEESYLLTPASSLLVRDKDTGASPFLLAMLDQVLLTPWQSLSVWFHSDVRTPILKAHEMDLWGLTARSEAFNRVFNEGMASTSRLLSKWLVQKQHQAFVGLKSLVDVGGGTGALTLTIAKAFPSIKCTVLELPHVVADAPEGTPVNFVEGNMFEYVPPSDAVILKWILHDWNDEECVKILKQCKTAIPTKEEGGKVMIVDMVVNSKREDVKATETQLCFDVLMMVVTGGREREEHEWEKMFIDAGFSDYKVTHGSGVLSLIEVYP
ncbi:Trans-resveratrol di-O-methyltransferase [Acorus calamus]|uniref:Trans-resveratrol di-O-methyltransferase n=1 Tax=Acorus calamus TaxID=4465 RepID=A0AAV9CCB2_ACOCL|nr:Trans-resveratrol di-O-methyltransferase [Acorus calamus]